MCGGRYAKDSRLSALRALIMVVSVDTKAEHIFDSVKEDNPMAVKMIYTVGTLS
jgi:hypothetical protein